MIARRDARTEIARSRSPSVLVVDAIHIPLDFFLTLFATLPYSYLTIHYDTTTEYRHLYTNSFISIHPSCSLKKCFPTTKATSGARSLFPRRRRRRRRVSFWLLLPCAHVAVQAVKQQQQSLLLLLTLLLHIHKESSSSNNKNNKSNNKDCNFIICNNKKQKKKKMSRFTFPMKIYLN